MVEETSEGRITSGLITELGLYLEDSIRLGYACFEFVDGFRKKGIFITVDDRYSNSEFVDMRNFSSSIPLRGIRGSLIKLGCYLRNNDLYLAHTSWQGSNIALGDVYKRRTSKKK